jgi:hypothetical protein
VVAAAAHFQEASVREARGEDSGCNIESVVKVNGRGGEEVGGRYRIARVVRLGILELRKPAPSRIPVLR